LSSIWTPKDEYSEIIANITATLHMNTPEQTMNGVDIDDFDDNNENKQQQLIEQLKIQLIQDQIKRTQPRNYTRILNQSNTPAQWYKAPPINRSVYFYDPNYQKYVQQRINSLPKTSPNTLVSAKVILYRIVSLSYSSPIHLNPYERKIVQLIIHSILEIIRF